jgi:phage shock protein A
MTLTNEQIIQLANSGDVINDVILTLDRMGNRINELDARIQQLEMREAAAKTTLRVVNDAS